MTSTAAPKKERLLTIEEGAALLAEMEARRDELAAEVEAAREEHTRLQEAHLDGSAELAAVVEAEGRLRAREGALASFAKRLSAKRVAFEAARSGQLRHEELTRASKTIPAATETKDKYGRVRTSAAETLAEFVEAMVELRHEMAGHQRVLCAAEEKYEPYVLVHWIEKTDVPLEGAGLNGDHTGNAWVAGCAAPTLAGHCGPLGFEQSEELDLIDRLVNEAMKRHRR